MRKIWICVIALGSFGLMAYCQTPTMGTVHVAVMDENAKPLAGANVDAERMDEFTDMDPMCLTAGDGTCSLRVPVEDLENRADDAKNAIVYRISASKYYSGYPRVFTRGPCAVLTQEVTAAESRRGANVTLHIGPKAGIVRMTISDAETGKRIQGGIDFQWGGGCPEKFSVGLGLAGEDRLVAPNIPVKMTVDSPGYEPWEYRSGRVPEADSFILRPSEVLTLDVHLHPKK